MRRARRLRSGVGATRPPAGVGAPRLEGTWGGRGRPRRGGRGLGVAERRAGPSERRRGPELGGFGSGVGPRAQRRGGWGCPTSGTGNEEGPHGDPADSGLEASPPCKRGGWRGASLGPPWPRLREPDAGPSRLSPESPVLHAFGGLFPAGKGGGGPPRSPMPRGPAPMSLRAVFGAG